MTKRSGPPKASCETQAHDSSTSDDRISSSVSLVVNINSTVTLYLSVMHTTYLLIMLAWEALKQTSIVSDNREYSPHGSLLSACKTKLMKNYKLTFINIKDHFSYY